MVDDQASLERRLDAGEWLSSVEVAKLLGVGRTTVHRMLTEKPVRIRYTLTPGGGQRRHKRCNPEDVRRELDEKRRLYGEGDDVVHLMPPGPEKAAALDAIRRHAAGEPPPTVD